MSFAARLAPRSPAAVGGGYDMGFNFRRTAGDVTDRDNEVHVASSGFDYPTVFNNVNGDQITAGWLGATALFTTTGATDPNLYGATNSGGTDAYFRVDVTGTVNIYLGVDGDSTTAINMFDGDQGGTPFYTQQVAVLAGEWWCIDLTVTNEANWTATNRNISQAFGFNNYLTVQITGVVGRGELSHIRVAQP